MYHSKLIKRRRRLACVVFRGRRLGIDIYLFFLIDQKPLPSRVVREDPFSGVNFPIHIQFARPHFTGTLNSTYVHTYLGCPLSALPLPFCCSDQPIL